MSAGVAAQQLDTKRPHMTPIQLKGVWEPEFDDSVDKNRLQLNKPTRFTALVAAGVD